jgi:tripartite-type tricarboxylate transporter receptor subunit TctC
MIWENAMKLPRRNFLHIVAGAAALPIVSRIAHAQAYPSRPIRLVVPFPPGGVYDAVARPWSEKVKSSLGAIVIENVGGGGSSLGAASIARAKPDGYALLMGGTIPFVNEALLKNRPLYDPFKDLETVCAIAVTANSFVVHPSVPARTLGELIAYAKSNPGKLSYGHVGVGSTAHLAGELLKSLAGSLSIVQVPYRGAAPAITDLLSGQIPLAVVGMNGQLLELHRTAKLRVLAVTSPTPLIVAPDLPTMAQQGFSAMSSRSSVGLLAPTGTPRQSIEQVARATREALADQEYQKFLINAGMEPVLDSSPEKFRSALEADVAQWRPVVAALALKLD